MSTIIWDISHTIYPKFIYNLTITSKKAVVMKIKEAVAQRIINLCKERNIAVNALGNLSGINPSTIYSMLNTKSQNPGVVSLQKSVTVLKFQSVIFSTTICLTILSRKVFRKSKIPSM